MATRIVGKKYEPRVVNFKRPKVKVIQYQHYNNSQRTFQLIWQNVL